MAHRTQLYLEDEQYRWLKRRAGARSSLAAVVRELIDEARSRRPDHSDDPLLSYLTSEPAAEGREATSVEDLDHELYGASGGR